MFLSTCCFLFTDAVIVNCGLRYFVSVVVVVVTVVDECNVAFHFSVDMAYTATFHVELISNQRTSNETTNHIHRNRDSDRHHIHRNSESEK